MTARLYLVDSPERMERVTNMLRQLPVTPKQPVELVVRKPSRKRSNEQNRRYWAVLNDIADVPVQGRRYPAETWHEYFKGRFIGYEEVALPNGKTLQRPLSTTTLTVEEFANYMTQIEVWAAQHGILLEME